MEINSNWFSRLFLKNILIKKNTAGCDSQLQFLREEDGRGIHNLDLEKVQKTYSPFKWWCKMVMNPVVQSVKKQTFIQQIQVGVT